MWMSRVPLSLALNLLVVVTVITLQGLPHSLLFPYLYIFYTNCGIFNKSYFMPFVKIIFGSLLPKGAVAYFGLIKPHFVSDKVNIDEMKN